MNYFLAGFSCFLWGTAFVCIKLGLSFCGPLSYAGMRFILAGLILLPFWIGRKSSFTQIRENYKTILLLSLFQCVCLYSLLYIGMDLVPGALGAIIVGSAPLFCAVLAHIFTGNDKMTVRRTVSIFIGLAGVIVISLSRRPWEYEGLIEVGGILLLLLSIFSSGLGNIIVYTRGSHMNPVMLNSMQILIGGTVLMLMGITFEGKPSFDQPLRFYLMLFWLAGVSATAFSIWFFLLKHGMKVSRLNLWKFLVPVFGALLGWIFIPGESPGIFQLLGMALIVLSIISYNLPGEGNNLN